MTKNIIISVLSLVSFCVTPLFAQESCYEQYLREHNMKILIAEDADDSYDELKKTVLAKQMYGDSYLLMVDTVAQRTVITKVDGTYIADVHVALVDSTWYMWLSVDPLSDKNIANSPYMYCNGNPIMFIDPDGRDIYTFDSDGNFTGNIIKQDGEHIGRILLSEEKYMDFSFNDQSDVKRICRPDTEEFYSFGGGMDNNAITHITFFSDKDINGIIPQDIEGKNFVQALAFAFSESRSGKLDFVNSAELQSDANALFIPLDGKNISYNNFDFGNYLWGQSMKRLGISYRLSIIGANVDNMWHHGLQLDSPTDQQAIKNGYHYNANVRK